MNIENENNCSEYLKFSKEKALKKEENGEHPLVTLFKETNEGEKIPNSNSEYINMDHKQDYLMEYFPINQSKSFDIIKKFPSSLKSLKEDFSNLPLPIVNS